MELRGCTVAEAKELIAPFEDRAARVQEFYGSFVEAAWRGEFDHSFRFTFRFPFGLREASLRLFSDGRPGGIYIFVDPVGEVRKVAQASSVDGSVRKAS